MKHCHWLRHDNQCVINDNGVIKMNKKNEKRSLKCQNVLCTYLFVNKNQFLPNNKQSDNFYFNHKVIADNLNWSSRKVYRVLNECIKNGLINVVSNGYFVGKYSRLLNINLIKFSELFNSNDQISINNVVNNEFGIACNLSNNETPTDISCINNNSAKREVEDKSPSVSCANNVVINENLDEKSTEFEVDKLPDILYANNVVIIESFDKKTVETECRRFLNSSLSKKSNQLDYMSIFSPNNVVIIENIPYTKTSKKSINSISPSLQHFLIAHPKIELVKPIQINLVNQINATNRSLCEQIVFDEKITIKKTPKRYSMKKSCRATSKYCTSKSELLRPELNRILNLNYSYDISACIPNMFNLLNNNIFDLDTNIRLRILNESNLTNVISENEMKPLLFRLIFTTSYEKSLKDLRYSIHKRINPNENIERQTNEKNLLKRVLPHWKTLYDTTHSIIGDTSLNSEIFKYESILELRTVFALREKNYYTSNVYDCFYSEASPDIIKNELIIQSKILYDDYVNNVI